ncbi:MAG: CDP-diacylglycerol--glycerol-3-phosphate 3-phosphatidyltransferase [Clostridia bacterium]|nr:CDP-diacylglycerol--glycerol-3-phosphate 3-phosphatidyltransferase [Clostridia bacterium]
MSKLNLPNRLTVMRLIMVPFCIAAVVIPEGWIGADLSAVIAAVIFIAASLTDMVDGRIARSRGLITDFGKFLDPLADKFMVIGTMLAIVYRYENIRPWFFWVVLIVVFREFAVTSIRLVASTGGGVVVAASWLGKVKTTMQMICICCVLLEPVIFRGFLSLFGDSPVIGFWLDHLPLTVVSSVLTVIYTIWSGVNYIKGCWKYLDAEK